MIISASRRTDIPAFFTPWLLEKIKEGFVVVKNPMNPSQVKQISLSPQDVDCIVFWTRNPRPLIPHLHELNHYHYYFLFTITPYGKDLEPNLPSKNQSIDSFIELSNLIGKDKVIWRYDPILYSTNIDKAYHREKFHFLIKQLSPYTERCIISFLDLYKKCKRNLKDYPIKEINNSDEIEIISILQPIAQQYGLKMTTCAENFDYSSYGVPPGKCIDDDLIKRICGHSPETRKDSHQRKACLCLKSVDIGSYNTCRHKCLYCYANSYPIKL